MFDKYICCFIVPFHANNVIFRLSHVTPMPCSLHCTDPQRFIFPRICSHFCERAIQRCLIMTSNYGTVRMLEKEKMNGKLTERNMSNFGDRSLLEFKAMILLV